MKKLIIFSLLALGFLPSLSFAAVTTDNTTYSVPASVTVSGGDGTNRFNVYHGNTWVCQTNSTLASQNLNSTCDVGGGTFDSMSSTQGSYEVVLQTVTDCNGTPPLDYASCSAGNPNIPGIYEADFTIGSGASNTSTTAGTADEQLKWLWYDTTLAIIFFAITVFVVWFLKT